MGRPTTGAITTGQCLKIHVSAFNTWIKKGCTFIQGTMDYSNGAAINVRLEKEGEDFTATIFYTKTIEAVKKEVSYKVNFVSVPSNLGKGQVYYFLCPFSQLRCKTLFMGYGSLYFKSLKAYSHRIYYPLQLSSRLDKHNDQYWQLDRQLEVLRK